MNSLTLTWDEKSSINRKRIALNVAMPIIAVLLMAVSIHRSLLDYRILPMLIGGMVAYWTISHSSKYHLHHVFKGDASGFEYTVMDVSKEQTPEVTIRDSLQYGILLRKVNCMVSVPASSEIVFTMKDNKQCLHVQNANGQRVDIRLSGLREADVIALETYLLNISI